MKTSREDLLAVAFRLFVSKGVAGTSMMDLARESGLSKGAFHHYFPRKDDLLDACLERYFAAGVPTDLDHDGTSRGFARAAADRYAGLLAALVAQGISLVAYQAFLWSMLRDGRIDAGEMASAARAELTALLANEGHSVPEVGATALLAAIEGAGALACQRPAPSAEELRGFFDAALSPDVNG